MNNKLKDDNVDFLFQAILALETMEECYDFFEDHFTVTELKANCHDQPCEPLFELWLRRL